MNSILDRVIFCYSELFVDDLQIFIQSKVLSYDTALANMQSDVNAIVDWTTANRLKLNPNKIKAINFGTVFQLNHLDKIHNSNILAITVSDVIVPYST